MNWSAPFIVRPIATTLLMIGVTLVGLVAYFVLPIAGVPQVDVPTIRVSAELPGANAETMASSVAGPLERQLSLISGVTAALHIRSRTPRARAVMGALTGLSVLAALFLGVLLAG